MGVRSSSTAVTALANGSGTVATTNAIVELGSDAGTLIAASIVASAASSGPCYAILDWGYGAAPSGQLQVGTLRAGSGFFDLDTVSWTGRIPLRAGATNRLFVFVRNDTGSAFSFFTAWTVETDD